MDDLGSAAIFGGDRRSKIVVTARKKQL